MSHSALPLLLLGLALLLSALAIFVFRSPSAEAPRPLTCFCLVALRLAIGWHFFVEGMDKLHSPAWTAEPYLREATGPLAGHFRGLAGDRLADKLMVGADGAFPAELEVDWRAYVDGFKSFYELNADETKKADEILEQQKAKTKAWLTVTKEVVLKTGDYPPPFQVEMTIAERLKENKRLEDKIRKIEEDELPKYGPDVFAKYKSAKGDLARWRGRLKADLDGQTSQLKAALRDQILVEIVKADLPADEQAKLRKTIEAYAKSLEPKAEGKDKDKEDKAKKTEPTPEEKAARDKLIAKKTVDTLQNVYGVQLLKKLAGGAGEAAPTRAEKAFEHGIDIKKDRSDRDELLPAPPPRPRSAWRLLDWSDFFVKWGITVVGMLLIAGLLTRTACLVGAVLLLSFFLAMPPLPGWPESPRVEGHYLYINKNIIEMLALVTLATTRSGRWAGLDGLLQFLRPSAWKNAGPSSRVEDSDRTLGDEKLSDAPTIHLGVPETKTGA